MANGTTLLALEPLIRPGGFAIMLPLMALWNVLGQRRHQQIGRWIRRHGNLGARRREWRVNTKPTTAANRVGVMANPH